VADRKAKVSIKGPARVSASGPDVFDDSTGETVPASVWRERKNRASAAAAEKLRASEPPLGVDLSQPAAPGAREVGPSRNPLLIPGPERFIIDASMGGASPALEAVLGRRDEGLPIQLAGDTGTYPKQTDAGLLERFMRWLHATGQDVQPTSRDVAEGIDRKLPESVGGKKSVEKLREKYGRMDADLNSI
jgi:hypothetical protein